VRPLGTDFWLKYSEIVSSQERTYKGFFEKTLVKKGTRFAVALINSATIKGFVICYLFSILKKSKVISIFFPYLQSEPVLFGSGFLPENNLGYPFILGFCL
jgi:hypothetical protein